MWHEGKLFRHYILCVFKSVKNDFLYLLEYYNIFFSFISFERNVRVQMKIRIISNHTWKHSKIILCFSLLFMISFSVPLTSWFVLFHFVFKESNKNKKSKLNKFWLLGWFRFWTNGWLLCYLQQARWSTWKRQRKSILQSFAIQQK